MKKIMLSAIFSISCLGFSFPQSITFEKYYDYGFAEAGNSVQQTSDGGYIIFGRQGITFGVSKVLLIKTYSNGQEQWHNLIGGNNNDNFGHAGQQTIDGGYIIAGYTTLPSFGYNIYLIKTDSNGDTLWTKNYGGSKSEEAWSVQQTTDGGYIIAGYQDSTACLIKTDTNGSAQWFKNYKSAGYKGTVAYSVQQTSDGGYAFTGIAVNNTGTFTDVLLVKTDSNGDTLWTKTYGGISLDYGRSVKQTSDGGYIITGYTGSFGNGSYDVYLIKTNSSGDTIWTKTYGDQNENTGWSVNQTTDGGYILGCTTATPNPYDLWLIKTNANGDTIWTKTFGDTSPQYAGFDRCLQQTSDGGFVITGLTDQGFGSAYLIKTDSTGYAPNGIPIIPVAENQLTVYPNPFNTAATLIIPDKYLTEIELSFAMYDMLGRELLRAKINREKHIKIERGNLEQGIYLIRLLSKSQIIASGKIIIN